MEKETYEKAHFLPSALRKISPFSQVTVSLHATVISRIQKSQSSIFLTLPPTFFSLCDWVEWKDGKTEMEFLAVNTVLRRLGYIQQVRSSLSGILNLHIPLHSKSTSTLKQRAIFFSSSLTIGLLCCFVICTLRLGFPLPCTFWAVDSRRKKTCFCWSVTSGRVDVYSLPGWNQYCPVQGRTKRKQLLFKSNLFKLSFLFVL